ncbi:hypothetical protein C8R44DRAFT_749921 [Mycena epipterygia]|nr:hypothetical protein C8R44DRAFT_749921 [Mycena epipterygia]
MTPEIADDTDGELALGGDLGHANIQGEQGAAKMTHEYGADCAQILGAEELIARHRDGAPLDKDVVSPSPCTPGPKYHRHPTLASDFLLADFRARQFQTASTAKKLSLTIIGAPRNISLCADAVGAVEAGGVSRTGQKRGRGAALRAAVAAAGTICMAVAPAAPMPGVGVGACTPGNSCVLGGGTAGAAGAGCSAPGVTGATAAQWERIAAGGRALGLVEPVAGTGDVWDGMNIQERWGLAHLPRSDQFWKDLSSFLF